VSAVLAGAAILGAGARDAAAYAVNSHVVLCDDILDTLRDQSGIWLAPKPPPPDTCPAESGPVFVPFPPSVRQSILQHPQFFRGGCVAPDGHVIPLVTDITHAEAFDPQRLATLLIGEAEYPQEIAYAYGWLVHGAVDSVSHGFSNHFADGPFSAFRLSDPSTWKHIVVHLRSEAYVQDHWIRTKLPPPPIEAPLDFLRRQFLELDGAALRHLILQRDLDPGRLDALQAGAVAMLEAIGEANAFLARLTAAASAQARTFQAEADAVKAAHPWSWYLRPSYYLAAVKAVFFREAALAVGRAWQGLRELQFEFLSNNLTFSRNLVARGDVIDGLKSHIVWLLTVPGKIFKLVGESLFELLPQWAEDLSVAWSELSEWVSNLFNLGIQDWILARFADAKQWLLRQALRVVRWVAQPFLDALAYLRDVVFDAAFSIPTADIDADFLAAGAKKDTDATGANLGCLRGYHFYRNARLLALAALSDPGNLAGIHTFDGTCEFRRTRFFADVDEGTYTNFVQDVGPEPYLSAPYCFTTHVMAAGAGVYPWVATYDPAKDFRLVEVCEAGETKLERIPPSVCGLFGAPQLGRCAAGKGFFVSDRLMPEACNAGMGPYPGRQQWGMWALQAGTVPAEGSPIYTQYHNHNIFRGSPVVGIGATADANRVAVVVRATTEPPAPEAADYRLLLMNADGTGVETAHVSGPSIWPSPHFETPPAVRWSPDGARIAFEVVGGPDNPNLGRHYVAAPGQAASQITDSAGALHWGASGAGLVYYKKRGEPPGFGLFGYAVGEACAPESPLTPPNAPSLEWPFAVSRQGQIFHGLYPPQSFSGVPDVFATRYGVRSEDGAQSGAFDLIHLNVDFATWSPNGRHLAVSGIGGALPRVAWADFGEAGYPADGQGVSVLEIGKGMAPAFSPDGRYLAYESFTTDPACPLTMRFDGITVVDLSTPAPFARMALGLPAGYPSPAPCSIPHRFETRFSQPGDSRPSVKPRIFGWGVSSAGPVLFASFPVQKPAFCTLSADSPPCPPEPFGNEAYTQAPDYDVFQHTLSGDWTNLTEDWRAVGRTASEDPFTRCTFTRLYSDEFHVVGVPP
jgi:hypothetical protein